ncbi:MAG TPA: MoxR family ATPase [Bacillota bacterium]|nr:MoxR family ATPase [Bacillota bacterium]
MGSITEWGNAIEDEYSKVVIGYEKTMQEIMVGMVAGGHVLLEGVPGVGKTLIVKTLAQILGLDFRRIQFTPDLMPTDILGTNIFNTSNGQFQLRLGPVFTQFLLADEINRTPPRTQAALLEAMEERQVTIDGESHRLPEPFMVFATQNPVEYEGTYPLPEAQLDRFMLKILLGYPSSEEENRILQLHAQTLADPIRVLDPLSNGLTRLKECMQLVKRVRVEDKVIDYINQIVRSTRTNAQLTLGVSPRGGVHLLMAAKAFAAISDRDFVLPDDVKAVVLPVLRHRILLRPEVEMEGFNADDVLKQMVAAVAVPR